MANKTNIGEAALILGCLYFLFYANTKWWAILGLLILIGFGVATWEHVPKGDEIKDLINVQIEEVKMRNIMMQTQIKLFAAQTINYLKAVPGGT